MLVKSRFQIVVMLFSLLVLFSVGAQAALPTLSNGDNTYSVKVSTNGYGVEWLHTHGPSDKIQTPLVVDVTSNGISVGTVEFSQYGYIEALAGAGVGCINASIEVGKSFLVGSNHLGSFYAGVFKAFNGSDPKFYLGTKISL